MLVLTSIHGGQLSIVQPLLVTELVFALLLRRFWLRQHIAKTAWTAALVTCGADGLLDRRGPQGGHRGPIRPIGLRPGVFGGIVAVLACRRAGDLPSPGRALRHRGLDHLGPDGSVHQGHHRRADASGVLGTLEHWPLYALIVAAVLGSVLQQAALQVGPLSVSQPLIVVVDPAVAIVLSVWIFDERFTASALQRAFAGIAFCVMAVAVVVLSRAAPTDLDTTMADTP